MDGYLLPLSVAALALYASTLASRLLSRLRDLHLLSKLPHPPATSVIKGVDITRKDFHRMLTQFAGKYGGIYSIRLYHEKVGFKPRSCATHGHDWLSSMPSMTQRATHASTVHTRRR